MLEHLTEYFELAHKFNRGGALQKQLAVEKLSQLAARTRSERLRFRIYAITGSIQELSA